MGLFGTNKKEKVENLISVTTNLEKRVEGLEKKVENSISIKEVDNKIANEFGKTSARIGGLEERIKKIQREQNEFISDQQNALDAESSRLEDEVNTSIKKLETQVDSKVKKCENLINNHKDEFNSQRDKLVTIVTDAGKNLRQETEKLLQQQQVELEELKNKVKNSISIKEVDNKIANQIGGLAAHIGEIQEKQEYQQKIRLALKKVFDIKYNNLENKVKESEKKIADEVKLRQETEKRFQQQQGELEELKSQIIYNDLENKVDTSIKELKTKVDGEVKQCENLIKTHRDELENQRVESKQQLDNFTQQLDNKVATSIKELESKVAGGVNQCENLINNFKGELNSQRDNLESIVADAGKALRQETEHLLLQQKAELEELKSQIIYNDLENKVEESEKKIADEVKLRQETEKLLQQQQEELEELKSQLQAKRKPHPLSIVTLIVSIAALLVAIVTFCTGNPATDIEAPTPTTMEIETTTEVPAAQH